jgi:hypothetical protein
MTKLAEAILDPRVRSPNYFSGRLLAASDLAAERDAHLARQRMLGRAIGAGIVEGLWVAPAASATAERPAVTVSKGFAIDLDGQLLSLSDDQTLVISETFTEEGDAPETTCLFRPCIPPSTDAEPSGDGFYLLVMGATSRFEETAPMQALQTTKAGAGCGRKWAVPGVQFRLQPFNPLTVPGVGDSTRNSLTDALSQPASPAVLSRLRNLLAHLCFASDELAAHTADPWAVEDDATPLLSGYGVVDYLRRLGLIRTCELPLALIYWTGDGLQFADCWAVRRRVIATPLSPAWPSLSSQRLSAENEARLLQFQEHSRSLLDAVPAPSALAARDYFRFLPAVGLLSLATTTRKGFTTAAYFNGLKRRAEAIHMDSARLRELLNLSLTHPPIDTETDEVVFIYRPHRNKPLPPASAAEQTYAVFASGHLPYVGTARFDLARWNRSNYGLL